MKNLACLLLLLAIIYAPHEPADSIVKCVNVDPCLTNTNTVKRSHCTPLRLETYRFHKIVGKLENGYNSSNNQVSETSRHHDCVNSIILNDKILQKCGTNLTIFVVVFFVGVTIIAVVMSAFVYLWFIVPDRKQGFNQQQTLQQRTVSTTAVHTVSPTTLKTKKTLAISPKTPRSCIVLPSEVKHVNQLSLETQQLSPAKLKMMSEKRFFEKPQSLSDGALMPSLTWNSSTGSNDSRLMYADLKHLKKQNMFLGKHNTPRIQTEVPYRYDPRFGNCEPLSPTFVNVLTFFERTRRASINAECNTLKHRRMTCFKVQHVLNNLSRRFFQRRSDTTCSPVPSSGRLPAKFL